MTFTPRFEITPRIAKTLMDIECSRQAVSGLSITVPVLLSLRESARIAATHYSTKIEGNRLTPAEIEEVLQGKHFPGYEQDEREVKQYYLALDYVRIKGNHSDMLETHIMTMHGLMMEGKEEPTPYRDGQNVIKDSASGKMLYMPPEAKDIPEFMHDLVEWINTEKEKAELPVPLIAAIAHYQFATIHPYYDGNGRMARLLTNLVLHNTGYGLRGMYALESYYARDLEAYYDALTIGEAHNFYFGRTQANITPWIEYFCIGMAEAFANIRARASEIAHPEGHADPAALLRGLGHRQKRVLSRFKKSQHITTKEVASLLGIHRRSALNLCRKWVDEGFITQQGASNKTRAYALSEKWLKLVI